MSSAETMSAQRSHESKEQWLEFRIGERGWHVFGCCSGESPTVFVISRVSHGSGQMRKPVRKPASRIIPGMRICAIVFEN